MKSIDSFGAYGHLHKLLVMACDLKNQKQKKRMKGKKKLLNQIKKLADC